MHAGNVFDKSLERRLKNFGTISQCQHMFTARFSSLKFTKFVFSRWEWKKKMNSFLNKLQKSENSSLFDNAIGIYSHL